MNYIKRLEYENEALRARLAGYEDGLAHFRAHLESPKFHGEGDDYIQVKDLILGWLPSIRERGAAHECGASHPSDAPTRCSRVEGHEGDHHSPNSLFVSEPWSRWCECDAPPRLLSECPSCKRPAAPRGCEAERHVERCVA